VVLVLADRQRARVLVYRAGEVEEPEDLIADTFMGDLSDVGVRKRGVKVSGVRGETSTDQAQRILEVSSERMWKALGESVAERAAPDGWIALGGPAETVGRLAAYLPEKVRDRVIERSSLHLGMSLAEAREAAEDAASEMSRRLQARFVDEVVDAARSGGKGALGRESTVKALREMRVDRLLLTRSFRESDPDLADRCVGTALLQDADIEEVAGEGAERLEAEGGGVGARLRYRLDGDEGNGVGAHGD
jgi:peptide subunit release factor 1 (eRF1)